MNSDRTGRLLLPWLILLLAGWGLRPWEGFLSASGGAVDAVGVGRSGSLAVLGGFRSAAAGACWLRANLAWERRDEPATRAWLEGTVALDPRPAYFWCRAARMMACDFPVWRTAGAPVAVREAVAAEEAGKALAFLEKGLAVNPAKADLLLEMADLRLRCLGDVEGAARLFRRAAEQPGAPYHAARIHAELLRRLGRPAEALAWLRAILPGLPADDPAARRAVVLQRMVELERETGGR